jgi:hypothetical protein
MMGCWVVVLYPCWHVVQGSKPPFVQLNIANLKEGKPPLLQGCHPGWGP